MINIDFKNQTYTCSFCGKEQSYSANNMQALTTEYRTSGYETGLCQEERIKVLHIKCTNQSCKKITVVARKLDESNKQWDLIPENVYKQYPDYIPQQIRDDYQEACLILDKSPKAAATLLRRCLQGMIRDFWKITEKNLNAEITELKNKISPALWRAIDGLRKLGNIGAHMESDVNLIVDIEDGEALKLCKLIETCIEKWYVSRHEEELLYNEITDISQNKEQIRKGNDVPDEIE